MIKNKTEIKFEEDLVNETICDFKERQKDRKIYESNWLLNINFYLGNQYSSIGLDKEVIDQNKQYFWQEREVYNHISPIIEQRLCKLARVRPSLTVVPFSDDLVDIYSAKVSKKILKATMQKLELSKKLSTSSMWSEICGTSIYKVTWNSIKGLNVGKDELGQNIFEGDVDLEVVSPFEIFPDSNTYQNIEDCSSIIHARAFNIEEVKNIWGIDVEGQNIDTFTFDNSINVGGLGYVATSTSSSSSIKKDSVLVLEKYEKPTIKHPFGRLIIVAGNKLVYIGELPYLDGENNTYSFPFIKQVAITRPNCFWGISIIERCIPIQRAFNAVKNRKHEFLNRLTMGIMAVEDGSVDCEDLEVEGLSPGKVLLYRQGSTPPKIISTGTVPMDFQYEENSLITEFLNVSGVGDLLEASSINRGNVSGVALQLLIEQDEMKMTSSAEEIKNAAKNIAKHILRLYKQFVSIPHTSKIIGDNGAVEMFYWKNSDITSEDVIFETSNEMNETIAQKRSMIFDILNAGILNDEDGKLSNTMRHKILQELGFGVWENTVDIKSLQINKAIKEDTKFIDEGKLDDVLDIDDHELHINEHIAFLISGEFEKMKGNVSHFKELLLNHIKKHKEFLKINNKLKNEAEINNNNKINK